MDAEEDENCGQKDGTYVDWEKRSEENENRVAVNGIWRC